MSARWWSFGVWALVAASALSWGMKLFAKSPPVPPHALVADTAVSPNGDLTRLFGDDPPPAIEAAEAAPPADARFQLVGVVSPRSPNAASEALAVIAVDGQPAKAYRVGAVVDGPTVLQAVRPRGATLGPRGGAAQVALEIAAPMPAATGTLPGADARGPGVPRAVPMLVPPPQALPTPVPMPVPPRFPPAPPPAALPPGPLGPPAAAGTLQPHPRIPGRFNPTNGASADGGPGMPAVPPQQLQQLYLQRQRQLQQQPQAAPQQEATVGADGAEIR